MEYLWTKDVEKPSFPALDGNKNTDVLIIGGGMAGILCAKRLHDEGRSYILVEAKKIGMGITKGTTAVISAQHSVLYKDLIKKFGFEKAKLYLDSNLCAVENYRVLSEKYPCDFEEAPSYLYTLTDSDMMIEEAKAVKSLGFDAFFTLETEMPMPVKGAVCFPKMAQFHPLKFLFKVAKDLNIYENTFVEKIDGMTAITSKGNIRAKKIIVATHYPFINSHGAYFMKLYQKRSFVIALENAGKITTTLEDYAESGIYLRSYGDLLLVGGGDKRTGKTKEGFSVPREFAKKYYPDAKEKYAWANQDCISLDDVPYIGRYSKMLPNIFVASGFNEWGMTPSMVASDILCDMIEGRENPYSVVYDPDRRMLGTQLFCNAGETVLNLATPSVKRCSHLGCALKWNEQEKSWDCPCHGSRFDENGNVIENPAMKDAHV